VLGLILDALSRRHGVAGGAEISMEANPEDFSAGRARELSALGFTRLSLGAQSLDPAVLTDLGRRHDPGDVVRAVGAGREAGFENVSIDLIYGSPVEGARSWEKSIAGVVALGVEHASCYALTVEAGTPLGRSVAAGAAAPDPDIQADRFEHADAVLTASGLDRYEVSNWATRGRECHYNLAVWAQGEYLAYGNGAHGYREDIRYRNHRRLEAYIEAVEAGRSPRAGEEPIRGWDAEIDRLFVGLRRTVGVSHSAGTEALLASDEGSRLCTAGVMASDDSRLMITRPLLTDMVQRVVVDLPPPWGWAQPEGVDNVSLDA
jgi:oxygen-independent coproporphyrinogen-3 oxidase